MWRPEVDIWNVSQSLTVWLIKEGSLHEPRAKPAVQIPLQLPSWITSGCQKHWACCGNPNICLHSCIANFAYWIWSPSKTSVFATFYCFSCHTALATTSKEETVKTEPGVVPDLWGSIPSLTIISDVKQTWVHAFVRMRKLSPTPSLLRFLLANYEMWNFKIIFCIAWNDLLVFIFSMAIEWTNSSMFESEATLDFWRCSLHEVSFIYYLSQLAEGLRNFISTFDRHLFIIHVSLFGWG